MADLEVLAALGVTARRTTEVEHDVIAAAEARAAEAAAPALPDAQEEEEEEAPVCESEAVLELQQQLATVSREVAAVESALESLDAPRRSHELLSLAPPPPDAALRLAVGRARLAGLVAKRDALRASLQLAQCDAARAPAPLSQPLPLPRARAVLLEDDDFDASIRAPRAQPRRALAPPPGVGGPAPNSMVETDRDSLIRRGLITPFASLEGFERRIHATVEATVASARARAAARPRTMLVDAAQLPRQRATPRDYVTPSAAAQRRAHGDDAGAKARKRRREEHRARKNAQADAAEDTGDAEAEDAQPARKAKRGRKRPLRKAGGSTSSEDGGSQTSQELDSGDEVLRSDCSDDDADFTLKDVRTRRRESAPQQPQQRRIRRRSPLQLGEEDSPRGSASSELSCEEAEEDADDVVFDGGFRVPGPMFDKLFEYQRTGLKWLWELHCQRAGGIVGDEMGLGKTVQLAAFLGALHHSGLYKPSLVVCPATMLRQWQRELKIWYPLFKPLILHDSGVTSSGGSSRRAREKMITQVVASTTGVLLTTYEHLRLFRDRLLSIPWGYVVLDEGHKIRNPDAETTILCKQFRTVHRVIMTGAPIQNKLTELWSLFDFVFPGKLGTLPVFQGQFSVPIGIGGYANASSLQVSTAFRCAVVLRDLIAPYLLRRLKCDVALNLPRKTEQVLFCPLVPAQRDAYTAFLASQDVAAILEGQREALAGIDVLRKIVNHPDLLDRLRCGAEPDYGNPERSGKLLVVSRVLRLWQEQGHRCLLFAQTQQMLDILEDLVMACGYSYRRMDGSTPVAQRMRVIDEFNMETEGAVFVFLLTTKVGGLGVNLTGANRVLLYDPDWNPATDAQARERAWRVGQTKEVTVYRLITSGTIEEKVYHRQIYKQHLTDKILKDPKQRRVFKARQLADLFTFDEGAAMGDAGGGETAQLFAHVDGEVRAAELAAAGQAAPEVAATADAEGEDGGSDPFDREALAAVSTPRAPSSAAADDARILASLFSSNGIAGAMNHEAIAGGGSAVAAEAERVARRATQALATSREARAGNDVSVPTWTGRSGVAGAPGNRFAAGMPTSSELLARARARSAAAAEAGRAERGAAAGAEALDPDTQLHTSFLSEIWPFLLSRGGRACSEDVLQHFNGRVNALQAAPFRAALRQAASMEQEGPVMVWVLRAQFRSRKAAV